MTIPPAAWDRLARFWETSAQTQRWVAFNFVGLLGILVQMATLAALAGGLGLHYLPATGLAVEAAVLHNFLWHEHWTWSDRLGQSKENMWKRLLRFHLANGALSLGGNLVLMRFLVGSCSVNYAVANAVSITLCSFFNFFASDRLVFQGSLARPVEKSKS